MYYNWLVQHNNFNPFPSSYLCLGRQGELPPAPTALPGVVLVLLGPPGSGTNKQAAHIAKTFDLVWLSHSDLQEEAKHAESKRLLQCTPVVPYLCNLPREARVSFAFFFLL